MMFDSDDQLEVINTSGYLEKVFPDYTEEDHSEYFDKNSKQIDLLDKIIATEVSIFLMRRTSGRDFCASNIDIMIAIRRKFITEYEKKYGEYKYYNDDVIY